MSQTEKKTYNPGEVEEPLYRRWEEAGHFGIDGNKAIRKEGKNFCIMMPPPNVTGSLHIGHALTFTLQDIIVRYKRMDGYKTLWQPGTDHAGIATQNVVEKQLIAEGTTKEELGREKFLERVWAWKEQSGSTIVHQLRKLGVSPDWSRERFTMDEGLKAAVRKAFVALYNENLIVRGTTRSTGVPRTAPFPTSRWNTKSTRASSTTSATPSRTEAATWWWPLPGRKPTSGTRR